jgi:hypothetical protein
VDSMRLFSAPIFACTTLGQTITLNLRRCRQRSLNWTVLGGLGIALAAAMVPMAAVRAETPTVDADAVPLVGDGVYFYGQAPEPGTLGASYLVFESQGERVVGAIYMPFSSFDCFQGQQTGNTLALQITNSYTQETYDYAFALEPADAIADGTGSTVPLSLVGFHNLGTAGEAELELLQTCQGIFAPETELEI